jgi:hypothetical protein
MDDEREDDYEPGSFGDLNSGGTEAENPGSTSAGDCFKRRVLVATAAPEQWITKFVIWLRQMNSANSLWGSPPLPTLCYSCCAR